MGSNILSEVRNRLPTRWATWIAIIAAGAAIVSAIYAGETWKMAHTKYDEIEKPLATQANKQLTLESDQMNLHHTQVALEITQDALAIKPYLPFFIVRPLVAESPDLNTANDNNYLITNNITIQQIIPSAFQQSLKNQLSTNPDMRYIFMVVINRGEKKAKSVTFDDIIWEPKAFENQPIGVNDFNKSKSYLEVDHAYAILVDEALNITKENLLISSHFMNVCVNFGYTDIFDLFQPFKGESCVTQVINESMQIGPQ